MKNRVIRCPRCGKKLFFKSSKYIEFNIKLSTAKNEIRCKHCEKWIKFDFKEEDVKG